MFKPTTESIPPQNQVLRLKVPPNTLVHLHPLNPLAFILRAAQIHPEKIALVHDGPHPVQYTFSVWAQRVQNLAYALIQAGIKPLDRVAVISCNSPLIADAHHGVLAARAVLTLINTRLKPHEVQYILEHSGASLILADWECLPLVQNTGTKIPIIVSNDTGKYGDPYEEFLVKGRKYSQERGWLGLEPEVDENAPAVLCYTSGTTGRPKGVLTTLRGSYLAAIANAYEGRIASSSTYLWVLPMFHAAGWTYPWALTFAFAKQITLRTVDYDKIWQHFTHSNVTHYCGAPTVQIGIVNHPDAKKVQGITAIIAGAAPTAHLIGELEKKRIKPIHVYGLTETYGPFTRNYEQPSWNTMSLEDRSRLISRQGTSFITAECVRVVQPPKPGDHELVDVPPDGKTLGEIVTRGNIVMKEYFKDPQATKEAFAQGYFHSGDLAVMHPDGTIAILDRAKDLVISGGENASSLAIEQELAAHPHILEVSVVARPHEKWGERPMAFVILHPRFTHEWEGKHDKFEAHLKEFAKTRLPGFACPEWVSVVSELPKTSTGKIMKVELRKIVAKL